MSHHTDFDALRAHPEVDLQFASIGQPIPDADLIILPGSKNTRADLAFLIARGWPTISAGHLRQAPRPGQRRVHLRRRQRRRLRNPHKHRQRRRPRPSGVHH